VLVQESGNVVKDKRGNVMRILGLMIVLATAWISSMCTVLGAEITVKELNRGRNGLFVFDPELVRIRPGDTVHFVAVDKGHEVHSLPGMIPAKAEPFNANLGEDLDVTFVEPGIYVFACRPHTPMGMVGMILVGEPGNIDEINPSSLPGKAKARVEALLTQMRRGS
jgi:pseudoazurin